MNKSIRTLFVSLCALCVAFSFSGCASAPAGTGANLAATFGPPIARIANGRLAMVILQKNPGREAMLQAVADDLGLLTQSATAKEISEAVIRGFVTARGAKWGLLPGEQELLITGLLATRDGFLASSGAATVLLNDPRVGIYIDAIRQGINDGIQQQRFQATVNAVPLAAK